MTPKALALDFDGVVLDSTSVKSRAMAALFAGERPADVDAIVALHERLGGVDRYRKFEMIFADILRRPLSAEHKRDLGRRFSDLALRQVLDSPFIAGAPEMLARCRDGGLPVYVVSGTPEDELRDIVARRGLTPSFAEVHGSPRTKPEILSDLMARHGYAARDLLFVGDAITDHDAAAALSIPFVGVVPKFLDNPFAPTVLIIPDLTGLSRLVDFPSFRSNESAS